MTVRIPDYRTCGLQAEYRLYPLLRRLLSSTTNLGPGLNTRTDPARDGGYTWTKYGQQINGTIPDHSHALTATACHNSASNK